MEQTEFYQELAQTAKALMGQEENMIANLSNLAALLGQRLPQINWAGFYLMDGGTLVLGPFWGKPACIRIVLGRGVCGTAAAENRVQRIEDVHEFPGHIACDAASRSEIVLPIRQNGKVIGVMDLDSPEKGRFTQADENGLLEIRDLLESRSWTECGYRLQ